MTDDAPTGDLRRQMHEIHRQAVLRMARWSGVIAYAQATVFACGAYAAMQSPPAGRWYVCGPLAMLMGAVVVSWLHHKVAWAPFSPPLPQAPEPQATEPEELRSAVDHLREYLAEHSKPVNRSDLRDPRWWLITVLFLTTVPLAGSWSARILGSATYGVGVAWIYMATVIGLGCLQSRLVVIVLKQIIFAGQADDRDSPE